MAASFKNVSEYLLLKTLSLFIFLFPRRIILLWGRFFGLLFFYLSSLHRKTALANLMTAFSGEKDSRVLRQIARSCFAHFGQTLFDILKLASFEDEKRQKFFSVEGEENLKRALKEGKGALLFSAHLGNWEVASSFISKKAKLKVIARGLDNPLLEKEFTKIRKRFGAEVVYKQKATKEILQALRGNEFAAILIDQNVLRSEGVFVDFFGKKASTTPSLAIFHLRTKSPILPVFCLPDKKGTYHLRILEPLELSLEGDFQENILKITGLCTKIIENEIRKNPSFWLWLHQRWKSRPKEEERERVE